MAHMVLLIVLTVLAVWMLGAVALAFLTGGMIHERDEHDRPVVRGRAAARRHAFN
jgi:hypothetical protein